MKVLNYAQVHKYEERTPNARWEGWDLCLFTPVASAATKISGVYRSGRWGIEVRISPDKNGNWVLR